MLENILILLAFIMRFTYVADVCRTRENQS